MKTALVTGASRGIGEAIAERLAREGFNLVLTARESFRPESTRLKCEAHGTRVKILPADYRYNTRRVAAGAEGQCRGRVPLHARGDEKYEETRWLADH